MSWGTFTDQLGNTITLARTPQRIISLVPSQTELLAYLGLDSRVIGITKFCVHPPSWKQTKTIVGGTKQFNIEVIRSLDPDLIIGNKEENYKEGIEELRALCPVWMSDIITISDTFGMIEQIGYLTGTDQTAKNLVLKLNSAFSTIEKLPPLRTLYLIWRKPWMAAGSGCFINELITLSGLDNCLDKTERYPELTEDMIRELNPELILLSSEPYPFKQKHIDEIKAILPDAKITFVNGELFSWYGSRLLQFHEYVSSLNKTLS